jgi:hypothetical protein
MNDIARLLLSAIDTGGSLDLSLLQLAADEINRLQELWEQWQILAHKMGESAQSEHYLADRLAHAIEPLLCDGGCGVNTCTEGWNVLGLYRSSRETTTHTDTLVTE